MPRCDRCGGELVVLWRGACPCCKRPHAPLAVPAQAPRPAPILSGVDGPVVAVEGPGRVRVPVKSPASPGRRPGRPRGPTCKAEGCRRIGRLDGWCLDCHPDPDEGLDRLIQDLAKLNAQARRFIDAHKRR